MKAQEIYDLLEIPPAEKKVTIDREQGEFIYRFLQQHQLKRTLETGLGYGGSAAFVIAATGANHVAIDPYQASFNDQGLKNLQKLSLDQHLTLYRECSQIQLPMLVKENQKYDFIIIDGDHRYDGIFVDWYYADQLLADNGYVMFDDSWMRSTQMVAAFIRTNRAEYREVKLNVKNSLIFQKTGEIFRPWYHFKEFYTLRSIHSQLAFQLLNWWRNNRKKE